MSARRPPRKQRQQALDVLIRALQLIPERSRWTTRAWARDRYRHPVAVNSPHAVRFCLGGAVLRAAADVLDIDISTPVKSQRGLAALAFAELAGTIAARVALKSAEIVKQEDGFLLRLQDDEVSLGPHALVSLVNDFKGFRHEIAIRLLLLTVGRLLGELERRPSRKPREDKS